jgi:hypothetical protein
MVIFLEHVRPRDPINDATAIPMSHIRLKRSQKHMKDTSLDSFLRTIPNGNPVHVSIQNVAVRKDISSDQPVNQPIFNGDTVFAPAVLYLYRNGSTKLITTGGLMVCE